MQTHKFQKRPPDLFHLVLHSLSSLLSSLLHSSQFPVLPSVKTGHSMLNGIISLSPQDVKLFFHDYYAIIHTNPAIWNGFLHFLFLFFHIIQVSAHMSSHQKGETGVIVQWLGNFLTNGWRGFHTWNPI